LAASCIVFLLSLLSPALGQVPVQTAPDPHPPSATSTSANQADVPQIPGLSPSLRGWNAGVTFSSAHDSTTGWATIFNPAIGYNFNDVFSVDATIPIYMYRLAESRSTHPRPNAQLVSQRGEPGDIIFGLHAQFVPATFLYQATFAFTAPTGDEAYGLSTGRMTFDLSNQFQRTYGHFTPLLEIGAGDSTTLVNRTVNKTYTSLGPLAHFQVGLSLDVVRSIVFETDLYEQLPIGDQKIYGRSRNGKSIVVTGYNVTEDNGFTNVLDIPFGTHTTLSGYYNRSLRRHTDTAGVGITYVLRPAPATEDSAIDELFR
jgi:hypothetical protein